MDSTIGTRAGEADDVALDLKGLFGALLRRWPAIVAVTGIFALGAFALSAVVTPTYKAETRILIENREVGLTADALAASERVVVDQETVASQVQLLGSRDLARRVAEREGLADRSEFAGTGGSLLDSILVAAGIGRDPLRISPEERVIDSFMERLNVYRVDGSRVVVVEFTSADRELAASVANSVATEYMALQGEAKRRSSEDQTRWLGEEIGRLRDNVREAEAAVEVYRSGSDLLVGADGSTVARQQITDITNAIATARAEKAAADSRADELSSLISSGGLSRAAEVVDSDTFRALRSREAALRGRQSELGVTLLPGHPQMQSIGSQIQDIERQQIDEARRALEGLRNDARVADARVRALTATLNETKVTSAANGESEVELRALEREAASQRGLLEGLLVRYSEAAARQNAEILPADARVISRAAVPQEPVFPKPARMTTLAALAGFLLVVTWIFSVEFVTGRALVRVGSLPAKPLPLGGQAGDDADGEDADPRALRFRSMIDAALAASPVTAPGKSAYTDASVLHAALIADGRARVAVLTVGDPAALPPMIEALAHAAADAGTRVVLVDAISDHAGQGGPGLSDLIAGEAAFSDVIHRNRRTRAHEIGVGTRPLAGEGIGGEQLETVLSALESAYDLVVVQLGDLVADDFAGRPPVAADRVVLVGRPDDPAITHALKVMTDAGVRQVSILTPSHAPSAQAAA